MTRTAEQRHDYYLRTREEKLAYQKKYADENKAAIATYQKEYHRKNKKVAVARATTWSEDNPKRAAYNWQKSHAGRRGLAFVLTYDEWVNWWGDDFEYRGGEGTALCMCRYGDLGGYSLDNIYKDTNAGNARGPRAKKLS